MSDYLFRMNLEAVFAKPPATEEERFDALAGLIAKRLFSMVDTMEERGYIFEAGETTALAIKFERFHHSLDTSCYPFSLLWEELTDWAESLVQVGRREKGLCNLPTLPLAFSC